MQFTRTHIPSGRTWSVPFNASHHYVFVDPDGYPKRTLEKSAQQTIDTWNRQQPTEWHYVLGVAQ